MEEAIFTFPSSLGPNPLTLSRMPCCSEKGVFVYCMLSPIAAIVAFYFFTRYVFTICLFSRYV
jgi:hypothetical protein